MTGYRMVSENGIFKKPIFKKASLSIENWLFNWECNNAKKTYGRLQSPIKSYWWFISIFWPISIGMVYLVDIISKENFREQQVQECYWITSDIRFPESKRVARERNKGSYW